MASILPVPKSIVKKIESSIGRFIWQGWLFRVSMEEAKNLPSKGGLSITCVNSMCDSLLLSQMLRLLKCSDTKSIAHLVYWIGDSLDFFLPGVSELSHPNDIPDYFAYLESLIVFGKIEDLFVYNSWKSLSNKQLYLIKTDSLPSPKVEIEAGFSYCNVWRLLQLPVLTSSIKDIMFLLVHNKLPVKERLHRAGMVNNPFCNVCPNALVCDKEHFFCSCLKVAAVWNVLKQKILQLMGFHTSNFALINLTFPKCSNENEIVWLLGQFISAVWTEVYVKGGGELKSQTFFGFLRFKYKADQLGAWRRLSFPGLKCG